MRVLANTKKSTGCGYKVWLEWCKARNIDEKILTMDETKVNELMARFVQEVRRIYGKEYPPSSLNCVVSAYPTLLAGRMDALLFVFKMREIVHMIC